MKIQKCLIIVCVILVSICNAEESPQCYVTSMSTECVNMTGKFLNVFSERDMRSLIIRNSNMTALNKDDFVPFGSVTRLTVISCSLEFPRQENLFASLSYLTNLRIANSNINEDIRVAFSKNEDIKSLSLPGNKITIVRRSFLSGLFQIENIDLSSNRIELIEEGSFDELQFLKKINLENNRIGDKFDGKYVTLPNLECIICKKYDEKYHCSENDLTLCEKNRDLDQLWWMPPHVRIQLKHNPICGKLANFSFYTTPSPDNMKRSTLSHTSECTIDQSEKCFKHERRDLFLFESCAFQKQSSDPKKFNILSTTFSSISLTSNKQDPDGKEDNEKKTFPATTQNNLLIFLAIAVIMIASAIIAYIVKNCKFQNTNGEKPEPKEHSSNHPEEVPLNSISTETPSPTQGSVRKRQPHAKIVNNGNGQSPPSNSKLRDAILKRDLEKVEVLLEEGVDTNTPNEYGDYPIHFAIRKRDGKIAEALMNNESINKRNHHGQTPLHISLHEGCHGISEILIQKADVNIADSHGNTPLHVAASKGNERMIQLLLQNNANPTKQNLSGNTPLFEAACNGHKNVVKLLVRHGINIANNMKHLPIHTASLNGYSDIVQLLLENGCPVDEKTGRGKTPLHRAAQKGNLEVVRILLGYKADIHALNDEFNSVLHVAAEEENPEMIKLLLEKGANPQFKNKKGQTPYDISRDRGKKENLRILETFNNNLYI